MRVDDDATGIVDPYPEPRQRLAGRCLGDTPPGVEDAAVAGALEAGVSLGRHEGDFLVRAGGRHGIDPPAPPNQEKAVTGSPAVADPVAREILQWSYVNAPTLPLWLRG